MTSSTLNTELLVLYNPTNIPPLKKGGTGVPLCGKLLSVTSNFCTPSKSTRIRLPMKVILMVCGFVRLIESTISGTSGWFARLAPSHPLGPHTVCLVNFNRHCSGGAKFAYKNTS